MPTEEFGFESGLWEAVEGAMVDFNTYLKESRMAKAVAKMGGSFNFGDDAGYQSGYTLSKGAYLWRTVRCIEHSGYGDKKGKPRLGAEITLVNLADGSELQPIFVSFGTKAILSFVPSEDGKGIEPRVGGPSLQISGKTNWDYLRKSLFDVAPEAKTLLQSDLTVLEGLWAEMTSVLVPEERKSYAKSKTGDDEDDEFTKNEGPQMMPVITGIVKGGKPWEGGGGELEDAPAPRKAAARPGQKASAPVVEAGGDDEELDLTIAAGMQEGIGDKKALPLSHLRLATFKAVKASQGDAVAQQVQKAFDDKPRIERCLSDLGWVIEGTMAKASA